MEDYEILYYSSYLLSLIIPLFATTAGVVFLIISSIIATIVALIIHYVEAIPVYKLAKKRGVNHAMVALIPIQPCIMFVLASIPGEREIDYFGKFKTKLMTSILIYCGVYLATPALASVGGILALIPIAATLILDYIYLKDVIGLYNPDKSANNTASIIVTIANYFTGGLVRGIYMWVLLKKEPIEQAPKVECSVANEENA